MPFSVPGETQHVCVLQNEIILTNLTLVPGWGTYNIISPSLNSGETSLKFIFDYAVSPEKINLGNDYRNLSGAVSDIVRK